MLSKVGVLVASSIAALAWLTNHAMDSGGGEASRRPVVAAPASRSDADTPSAALLETSLETPLATSERHALECGAAAGGESLPVSTWEDVEHQFLSQMGLNRQTRDQLQSELMGGPVEVDLAWLEQRFNAAPGAPALYDAQVRALEMNLAIAAAGGEYLDELDFQVSAALREGRFERSDREIPAPAELEPMIFMQSTRIGGWATLLSLHREDHPRLDYLQDRVTRMVDARDQELARILRGG